MKVLLTLAFALGLLVLSAQPNPTYHYEFDQCSLTESNGALGDLMRLVNLPGCVCGPKNDALDFDGNSPLLMPVPGTLLQGDFTLSFYIRPEANPVRQSLFTNARSCNTTDSLFSLKYLETNRSVTLEIAEIGGIRAVVRATLEQDKCWQHVAIVKQGRIISMYVNGDLNERFEGDQSIDVFSSQPLLVGGTPCSPAQNVISYSGGMDEIQWFDRPLGPLEVDAIYSPVDEILTRDTLIFLGDSFLPRTAKPCANSISWSPGTGLSSTSIIDPIIGPSQTTSYDIRFDYGTCVALDAIRVTVVDPNDVDCEAILLPSAFTPNGDRVNDVFGISNFFIMDEMKSFEILDRLGNTLWEAIAPTDTWDGIYRGDLMPTGPYVYKVVYTCGTEEFAKVGSFTMLR